LRKDITYRHGSGYFTNRSDATKRGADGVLGGGLGAPSRHALRRADGTRETLPHKATNLTIAAGDTMVLETAGGGGWGPPSGRDPQRVLDDLRDGKVSAGAARSVYGVVLTADGGAVDAVATRNARGELSNKVVPQHGTEHSEDRR
jgi:N-methylhydantoinase B